MQQLIYTMLFKGHAAPSESDPQTLHVSLKAASCSITTVINHGGLTGGFDPAAVIDAAFESDVQLLTATTFTERGTISFGKAGHSLNFVSIVDGWMGQSPDPSLRQGTVTWKVDGGQGQFEGACGTITSNFTIAESGEVSDYHLGIIYLR
ncbi:MAG: hypothetical protein ABJF23_21230 [Bryobacteraceae bacterium]